MLLANFSPFAKIPNAISPLPNQIPKAGQVTERRLATPRTSGSCSFIPQAVSKDGSVPLEFDVGFPSDYSELLEQVRHFSQSLKFELYLLAKAATELALKDEKQLLEIEFPTAGLESVPGDGEGGIEMTGSMQLIREFCDRFIIPEKATRTRIFFPEANEVEFARKSAFGGASFKLDYLTKPSLFEDFGFVSKVKMADRVKPDDEMFLVAYPYFNRCLWWKSFTKKQ
ncbi:uncharacterized protein LOC131247892 isoform X3 [Magnolia sinica]|uniref:uncharacterized protein LOC131247892 isoform X3 n=1 Tax=Magnolia sinica TaxID=86752 RepID=UPI00265B05FA|nr:uncharacterized protein LOC131247892 isoform X3 [Magnolia sinica]